MAAEQVRKYSMVPERKSYNAPSPKTDVRPKRKSWFTKGEKVIYTSGLVIIAVTMAYTVQFSSSVDQLNRNIQEVNENIAYYQSENTTLQAKIKEMSKPSRIKAIAEEHGLSIKNATVKQATEVN